MNKIEYIEDNIKSAVLIEKYINSFSSGNCLQELWGAIVGIFIFQITPNKKASKSFDLEA